MSVDETGNKKRSRLRCRQMLMLLLLSCVGFGSFLTWMALLRHGPLDIPGLVDVEVVDVELWDLQVSPTLGRFHVTRDGGQTPGRQYEVHCANKAPSVLPETMGGDLGSWGRKLWPWTDNRSLHLDGSHVTILGDSLKPPQFRLKSPAGLKGRPVCVDATLNADELRLMLMSRHREDKQCVIAKYRIPEGALAERQDELSASKVEAVSPQITYGKFYPDGEQWVVLVRKQTVTGGSFGLGDELRLSDGRTVELPSLCRHFKFLDDATIILKPDPASDAALLEIDLSMSPARIRRLELGPAHDPSGFSIVPSSGRYVALLDNWKRVRRFHKWWHETNHLELSLYDREQGTVVAGFATSNADFNSNASAPYWRVCFNRDQTHIYLASGNQILTVELAEWIAACGGDQP